MRMVIGATVMVLGALALTAQPAFAREGAAPAGAAPLPTITIVAAPLAITAAPIVALAPLLAAGDAGLAPAASFRLAPLTLGIAAPQAPASRSSIATTDLAGGLHRRFTGTMTEYYPVAGSGFHLSGGSRLFARRNFIAETENSAHGALAVTRITVQSATTRTGFKRFNPVATAGYTVPLTPMAQIGVEAGAMMSQAYANAPGLPRHGAGYRSDMAFHPDAIANLVFGMHF